MKNNMINKLLNLFENVSIKDNVKFADKSFKYDTLYFAIAIFSKFIENNKFKVNKYTRPQMIAGFIHLLNLKNNKKAMPANANYLSESLELLRITKVIKKAKDNETYEILDKEIFDFIGMCMETSYIFQYVLAYKLFKNDNIWQCYVDFCNANSIDNKINKLAILSNKIQDLLENKGWVMFQTKFFAMVLGLANEQNKVTRTLNVLEDIIKPEDLANKSGTRSTTIKDNQYSDKFNLETVQYYLKDFLAFNFEANGLEIKPLIKNTIKSLPNEIIQLKNTLNTLDEDDSTAQNISKQILSRNEKLIEKSLAKDPNLIEKFNFENLKQQVNKAARKRDKLIAELAKKKAHYMDEFSPSPSFEGKDGKNYVECHHIIEFSTELGPDISLNLICLDPMHHSLIHHGSDDAVKKFFQECRKRNVISLNRFENMCTKYQCLTRKHVEILLKKSIINDEEAIHLYNLINIFGCDNAPKALNC